MSTVRPQMGTTPMSRAYELGSAFAQDWTGNTVGALTLYDLSQTVFVDQLWNAGIVAYPAVVKAFQKGFVTALAERS